MKDKVFFNRDISWLAANARILQEAEDETVPVAERIKFLGIFQSNLETFIIERYLPHLAVMREAEQEQKEAATELVNKIHKKITKQVKELYKLLIKGIAPDLEKNSVKIITLQNYSAEHTTFAKQIFAEKIKINVNPVFITSDADTILLENHSGYLVTEIKFHNEGGLALIEIPSSTAGRFIEFPSGDNTQQFLFVEDIIRLNLPDIFPGHVIEGCYALQQVSGSDFYAVDELKDAMQELKKQRKKNNINLFSFLFYEKGFPPSLLNKFCTLLGTNKEALVETGPHSNLKELLKFPKLSNHELYYKPFIPLPAKIDNNKPMLDAIAEQDTLLYFPYNSYTSICTLLEQTAGDSSVKKISVVLYRVAPKSRIIQALIAAAKNGKEVFVFQEVKASEDEAANILYARELEAAGAKVIRNFPGLKVHAKLLLISFNDVTRKDCAYLGTGNFNEKSAESYIDMGLLTTDARLTTEVKNIFKCLEQKKPVHQTYTHLLVAPFNMRDKLLTLINREITFAQQGHGAVIQIKVNNLEDKKIIEKLYEASNAGVEIQLMVRGICCLIPGKKKQSKHISAISVIDRFLEHARVFSFGNGGNTAVYVGSADIMSRNLDKRIEVIFPLLDASLIKEVSEFLSVQFSDNVKARIIDKKQKNNYAETTDVPVREQEAIYNWLAKSTNIHSL